MDIIWHGSACMSIKTKEGIAVINPYKADIGLKLPALKANIVLISEETGVYSPESIAGEPKIISWPGEYEVAGIAITAQPLPSEVKKGGQNMLFMLDAEGLKICYLTDLNVSFTEEVIENIGEVDVLIIPIGAEKNAYKEAHQIVEKIEPRAVIPMCYKTPGLTLPLEGFEDFAKQASITNLESKDKFTLNAKTELPEDKTVYAVLNPQVD